MYLHEIKDLVREHFGRTGISTNLVDLALQEGRKLIEQEANFWWMESTKDFTLIIDQQDYLIGPLAPSITISNFKDGQFLSYKVPSTTNYEPISLGTEEQSKLDLMYNTDDRGEPEAAIIKNKTLSVWPPKPDKAYDMRLYYYGYSAMPTSNLADPADDELLNNWGMTLVYSAIIWGYEINLHDLQGAVYWRQLLSPKITSLKRLNFKRGWKSQVELVPRSGPGQMGVRRTSNLQLYLRR